MTKLRPLTPILMPVRAGRGSARQSSCAALRRVACSAEPPRREASEAAEMRRSRVANSRDAGLSRSQQRARRPGRRVEHAKSRSAMPQIRDTAAAAATTGDVRHDSTQQSVCETQTQRACNASDLCEIRVRRSGPRRNSAVALAQARRRRVKQIASGHRLYRSKFTVAFAANQRRRSGGRTEPVKPSASCSRLRATPVADGLPSIVPALRARAPDTAPAARSPPPTPAARPAACPRHLPRRA